MTLCDLRPSGNRLIVRSPFQADDKGGKGKKAKTEPKGKGKKK